MTQEHQPTDGVLPPQFQPQRVPMAWVVGSSPNGLVAVTIFDFSGQRVLIFEHADAQRFIDDIAAQIPTARSGLVVPR